MWKQKSLLWQPLQKLGVFLDYLMIFFDKKSFCLRCLPCLFWRDRSTIYGLIYRVNKRPFYTDTHHIQKTKRIALSSIVLPKIRIRVWLGSLFIWKFVKVGKKARTEKEMTWMLCGDNDDTKKTKMLFFQSFQEFTVTTLISNSCSMLVVCFQDFILIQDFIWN